MTVFLKYLMFDVKVPLFWVVCLSTYMKNVEEYVM